MFLNIEMIGTILKGNIVNASRGSRMLAYSAPRASVIDSAKQLFEKANKKVGEAAALGLDKSTLNTGQNVTQAAKDVDKKAGETVAEGIHDAQASMPNQKARVYKNTKGYDSLADKGKKVESEQNRADDAV